MVASLPKRMGVLKSGSLIVYFLIKTCLARTTEITNLDNLATFKIKYEHFRVETFRDICNSFIVFFYYLEQISRQQFFLFVVFFFKKRASNKKKCFR